MLRLHTLGGLWMEGDSTLRPLGPRGMGLLAIVAAAGRKGISRERVLGILWAESAEEPARHTLAQNVYSLRRQTGREVIVGHPELHLGPDLSSDIGDVQEALAGGDDAAVADLYAGDFLHGFYLPGVPEFERWVEEERARIRTAVVHAHERLATRLDALGEPNRSIRVWRRLGEIDPLSARHAAGTMRALAALGDGPAALAHAMAYEELVRRELDSEPDPSIQRLAAALRRGDFEPAAAAHAAGGAAAAGAAPTAQPPSPSPAGNEPAVPEAAARRRLRRPLAAMLLAGLAIGGVAGVGALLRSDTPPAPLLAIGSIRVVGAPDSAGLGPVVRDMLATRLAAIPGLQVVANSRLVELAGAVGDTGASVLNGAARRAGAAAVVEGEVAFGPSGPSLSLRTVTLATGIVRHGYVLRGADRFALVDSAASALAHDLGLSAGDAAGLRATSPEALALYEHGLRTYFAGENGTAIRFMQAALTYDSTYAMAAYYAWQAMRGDVLGEEAERFRLLARRLAPHATERERLLIEGTVAEFEAPFTTTLAIADTLTVRYPNDPDGQVLLGNARFAAGDWAGAIAAFDRAVALDSAAGVLRAASPCRVCFALVQAAAAYMWWDSAQAAERAARRLVALRPDASNGWSSLVEPLLRQGRRAEAEDAARRADRIGGAEGAAQFFLRRDLIRAGRYEDLETELASDVRAASSATAAQARWLWLFALRDQGRLADAMALARDGTIPGSDARIHGLGPELVHLAVVPLENGQPLEAAARFRRLAAEQRAAAFPPGFKARTTTWSLTLTGSALAAAGDTIGLRAIADSVEHTGRGSSSGRDPRLHHFLRGLLLQIEGRHADAVAAFQRALFSTTDGYTRINLAMARSLLALGRAPEAIAILQPALRGGIDGSNTYVTRTDLHEALADAFTAAGMPDSARTHFAAVERALRNADPAFRPRYERARAAAPPGHS